MSLGDEKKPEIASDHQTVEPAVLRFGNVVIDPLNLVIYRDGQPVHLSEVHWALLSRLLGSRPNSVSKDDLLALGGTVITEDALFKRIQKIADSLDPNDRHRFIRAEPGRGYRFVALPNWTSLSSIRGHPPEALGVPRAQRVTWRGLITPGISIDDEPGVFIPWSQLKPEIEEQLLPKAARVVPAGSTITPGEFHGQPGFRVLIVNPKGKVIGRVWFGKNPEKDWAHDGLVRIGDAPTDYTWVVWQVYQRYSDGTYLLLRALDKPEDRKT